MILTIAAITIGVHTLSYHFDPELAPRGGYNNINPGAYVRTDDGWQLGGYYNSHRNPTVYAGWAGECACAWTPVKFGAGMFIATGYPAYPVVPFPAASLRWDNVRVSYTPRMGHTSSALVHLMFEWRR